MAERRMFSKKVINAARFLRMPATARLLYYDLGMYADDDGIVEAFTVLQMTRADEADLEILASKGFVRILNEDLVAYICDWKVNNYIQKDRYRPSIYADLLGDLSVQAGKKQSGNKLDTACIQNGYTVDTQDRKGEERIGKDRLGEERKNELRKNELSPPSFDSVSMKEIFRKSFAREPDKSFMTSISNLFLEGKTQEQVQAVIIEAATRKPRNPEAYILAALKQKQEHSPAYSQQTVYSEQDPNAPLADWEVQWLAEVHRRQEQQRQREQEEEQQLDGEQQEEAEEDYPPEDDRQGKEAVI